MQPKQEHEVTTTRHESGAFLASCAEFPHKVGIGDTPDEAVANLREFLTRPPLQPLRPPAGTTNPWAELAEAFRDTPLLDEWKEELAERRRLSAEADRGTP